MLCKKNVVIFAAWKWTLQYLHASSWEHAKTYWWYMNVFLIVFAQLQYFFFCRIEICTAELKNIINKRVCSHPNIRFPLLLITSCSREKKQRAWKKHLEDWSKCVPFAHKPVNMRMYFDVFSQNIFINPINLRSAPHREWFFLRWF